MRRSQSILSMPETTLADELSDCDQCDDDRMADYEQLQRKYKLIQLENNEYQTHISFLQKQNEDLLQQLAYYEDKPALKPMLNQLSSMNMSLSANDEEIKDLKFKLSEYSQTMHALQFQNKEFRKQIQRFEIVLENNNKYKTIMQRINDETANSYLALQHETELLRDELNAVKAQNTSNSHSHDQQITSPTPTIWEKPIHSKCTTPRIHFEPTPAQSPRWSVAHSNVSDLQLNKPAFHDLISERSFNGSDESSEYDPYNEYVERLQCLEKENKRLIATMNMEPNEDEDDESDDIFSEQDLDEMEQLFQRCDFEKTSPLTPPQNKKKRKKKSQRKPFFWIHFKAFNVH